MASEVDVTFPADNVPVSKADFRAEMLKIFNELTDLQTKTELPAKIAFGDQSV